MTLLPSFYNVFDSERGDVELSKPPLLVIVNLKYPCFTLTKFLSASSSLNFIPNLGLKLYVGEYWGIVYLY